MENSLERLEQCRNDLFNQIRILRVKLEDAEKELELVEQAIRLFNRIQKENEVHKEVHDE